MNISTFFPVLQILMDSSEVLPGRTDCRPRNSPAGTCDFRNLLHAFYFNPFRIFPKLLWGFRQHWEPQRCLRLFRRMRTTPRGEEEENKQDVPNLHPLPVINKRLVGRKRHFIYAQNKTRERRRSKWVAGESESFIWLSVSDQTGVSPPGFTILCQGPSLPLPRLFHVFWFFFCSREPSFCLALFHPR